jgi:hypothetical protein
MAEAPTTSIAERFAMTPERKMALMITLGAAGGVTQTILLQKLVDGSNGTVPSWMPQIPSIGQFNQPSAFFGIVGGLIAVLVGLYVPLNNQKIQNIAVAYGGSAIATGILSGLGMM